MPDKKIIDLHVHTTLKPYGQSFRHGTDPDRLGDKACLWTMDRNTGWDDFKENAAGITRYRQSDFSSMSKGRVMIAGVSLYPTEIGFLDLKGDASPEAERLAIHIASMFGDARIAFMRNESDGDDVYYYFPDLEKEYAFLERMHDKMIDGIARPVNILNNIGEIKEDALNIMVNIEGAHVFCDGRHVDKEANWLNVLDNIKTVKAWKFPPLYVSIGHHFYNANCTHGMSLEDIPGKYLNQKDGMREQGHTHTDAYHPISVLGYKVIDALLDKSNGRRILIDIKHMSLEARKAYYKVLETKYPGDQIPVICSHGASDKHHGLQINVNENDVDLIYKTKGLMGIELDQRILDYEKPSGMSWAKYKFSRSYREWYDAGQVWKQIETIAKDAYKLGYTDNPFACLCLGSDFDGIINPINAFRTAEDLPALYDNLIEHCTDFFENSEHPIATLNPSGQTPEQIVDSIMCENAYGFLKKHFVK